MKIFKAVKKHAKKFAGAVSASITMAVVMLSTFAADGSEFVAIQSSDLDPILEGAKANIGVIIPVGIGLFAMLLGIGFLPTIIKKFKNGGN